MDDIQDEQRLRRRRALGLAIQSRRETLGLSRSQFAVEVGTSRNMSLQWENGEWSPSVDSLWRICDVLNTTPSQLLAAAEETDLDLDED